MKKLISLLLGLCVVTAAAFGSACGDNRTNNNEKPVFDGWNTSNILERPTEKDDLTIGTWVTFANTNKGWNAIDQVERYYYLGVNFMPFVSTIPSAGMISEEEKSYVKRDLTSSVWWRKIDGVMQEYNMLYYFTSLAGIGGDHESCVRRTTMLSDEALSDARTIIPQLKNCIGVHVVDEPGEGAFAECAKWAKRYAQITDGNATNPQQLGLEALVNHLAFDGPQYANWMGLGNMSSTKILGHDYYPFGGNQNTAHTHANTNRITFIKVMNNMRQVANEYNVKLACFPQSTAWTGTRMPNLDEIKWNINTYLSHGFTDFKYFNLIMYPNEGCYDAVYGLDGELLHPELETGLTAFHKQLRVIDANIRLNSLQSTTVYMTGAEFANINSLPVGWFIDREGLNGTDLILSHFTPKADTEDKTEYLCITNNSFEKEVVGQEFYLSESTGITGLEWLNPETGKFEPVSISNGAFTLSFGKSEAKFLRITGEV